MKYTHIIWDYNGTLLDDMDAAIEAENILLRRRGMKEIASRAEYYSMFCFPVKNYYAKLGYDFSKESYESLADEWIRAFEETVVGAGLRRGARELLEAFADRGIPQLVLSACEIGMLRYQLNGLGVADGFCEIIGTDNVLASGKLDLALAWKDRNPTACPLLIGDTCHDHEVATAIGADCVLLEGGHNSRDLLLTCGACLYSELSDLYEAVIDGSFQI